MEMYRNMGFGVRPLRFSVTHMLNRDKLGELKQPIRSS